jgi:acetyl-CoA synthetase
MDLVSPTVRAFTQDAIDDPDAFWGRAAQQLPWFKNWERVLDWQPPTFRWFVGGQTNLSYNCLDYHVERGRAGHAALIAEDERGGSRVITYAQLLEAVKQAAAALRGLGVRRGDRLAIYMPTCPEALVLMLAATRIGAIHLVVFAGFGSNALAERIELSGARWVFATDSTWRKGKDVPLKGIVDQAVDNVGDLVERVVVLRRTAAELPFREGRDLLWEDFLRLGAGQDNGYEVMESNEPAFILATSGTTAKPKLVVHTHGPYQVHIASMARWVYGMQPDEVWWATSDIGWIVGHSYIVYAPLLLGCTTIAYEGALDHPGPQTFYRTIQANHVSSVFTSPTAVRLLMRYGADVARGYDLSSIRGRIVCAGEVLNPPAWEWLQKEVFGDRIAVLDHMWQTETSGALVGNPYGLGMLPIKPGSAGIPLPGIEASVVSPDGVPLGPGERGLFVVRRPFPGLTASIWGEPERYGPDYWQRLPGQNVYYVGDAAAIDEDGYVWFSGRADEIIKIASHRIGTIEVESAFLRHPAVVEAGVTGRPDELRGEVIAAFVVLKQGYTASDELRRQVLDTVRQELGAVAVIGEMHFVGMLPKTRSGKIMRRVLKAVATGAEPGDISTIEDAGSVDEVRQAWHSLTHEVAAGGAVAVG